MICAGWLIPC